MMKKNPEHRESKRNIQVMAIFRGTVSRLITLLGCLFGGGFSLLQCVHAQRPTGEIHIEVKDPSGAAVASSGKLENLSRRNSSAI